MAEETKKQDTGTLSGGDMDTSSVLENAEEWEPIETKLVVWSLVAAGFFLIIGLMLAPSSIFH